MRDTDNCSQCKDANFYCEDCTNYFCEIENGLMVRAEVNDKSPR